MTICKSFALLALSAACTQAWAADASIIPPIKVTGFGTAAMTWTDTDEAQYSRPNQISGVGKSPRTGVDSQFGVQADTRFNPWLSATVQGLVRKNGREGYRAGITWAFLKAKINDQWSVRAGRVVAPVFLISDYRNIGFANTTLRPPTEVYSQVPMDAIDGGDITYTTSFGDTVVTAQAAAGQTDFVLALRGSSVKYKAEDLLSMNVSVEHGPVTVRLAHSKAMLYTDGPNPIDPLLAGLRTAGAAFKLPALGQLAADLATNNKKASFTSLGAILDYNNIVGQGEYAVRKTDTSLPDTRSWYLTGGYRFGKFLPYYTHSVTKVTGGVANTVPTACAAPGCLPLLTGLRAGVAGLTAISDQTTDTLGVRWDFASSAALKVQVDRVRPQNGGTGLLLNVKPGFTGPVTVGAVAVDFVF